ncbi:hypothetical protein KOEU_03470 [Komagataeibacter europaeus]|uniref:Uncharacterized protein n=1 Tax=Komagataeibacter europaeus TaxID=33995 RepID=A0A0M0EM90_KOMEU|nr:hypothetical protein [Komagataeibacter europaeus]KON66374.1 hypothetical protein KOEU_03470 [Komagataeibacter europaeus]GBQ39563.1 hypothetical protein AA18890_0505 [Komagataeibacter europaeus LMG 18890]
MSDTIDPKELKILSDILALVLEEHAGQSENALAAIRTRAKKNQVTGGALKNLFAAIAPNPPKKAPPKPRAPRATKASAAAAKEIQESHQRISQLTESIRRLDTEIRDLKVNNEALQFELNQTRQARAETQAALSSAVQYRPPPRRSGLLVAAAVGALTGFALTETWHLFMSGSPAQASATYPPVHHHGQAWLMPSAHPLLAGNMPS